MPQHGGKKAVNSMGTMMPDKPKNMEPSLQAGSEWGKWGKFADFAIYYQQAVSSLSPQLSKVLRADDFLELLTSAMAFHLA